jgi:hypothetical protein
VWQAIVPAGGLSGRLLGVYYYPSYSLRAATILRGPPLRLQSGDVGQDGILRPIGNRPSDELASARKRRVANPPQVANLPYTAPESRRFG